MNKEQLMHTLEKIRESVLNKKEIHIGILANVFEISKEQAEDKLLGELEILQHRIYKLWQESKPNRKPVLTLERGVNIFIEVMQMGLTFSESAALVYVATLPPKYDQIGYQITVDGRIYLAQKSGAIAHISEPVIVRNDEDFKIISNKDGSKYVEHTISDFNKPFDFLRDYKCGYVFVTYPSGAKELKWVDRAKMESQSYNRANDSNKSMYNQHSFLQTKIIKYALRKERVLPFTTTAHEQEPDFVEYESDTSGDVSTMPENTTSQDAPEYDSVPAPVSPEPQKQEQKQSAPESDDNLFGDIDFNFNF